MNRVLNEVLCNLKSTDGLTTDIGPDFLYLYRSRGTGKTVQLNTLRNQVRQRPQPDILIRLTADRVETEEGMRHDLFVPRVELTGERLTSTDPPKTGETTNLTTLWIRVQDWVRRSRVQNSILLHHIQSMKPTEARLSAGLGSITMTLPPVPDRSAGESLLRLDGPVLITLDEAHMVKPGALRILLNAVQDAGECMPVALALAGTPDLTDRLRAAGASFWSRGHRLNIGCLEPEAAVDVIEQPMLEAGLTCDPSAVADLAAAADYFPFFLQLYGHEGFDAVMQGGTGHFDRAEYRVAITAAQNPRRLYYEELRTEFHSVDDRTLARDIALAFKSHDNVMTGVQLENLLDAMDPLQAKDRETFLRHKGYICEGREPGPWEPGIPSLMDYMIEVTGVS